MTQQSENDPVAVAPSLRAKVRDFIGGLTPDEQVQLRSTQMETDTRAISPSLRAKAQQVADDLTPEEWADLGLLVEPAGVGAAAGENTDAQGHMIAQDRVLPGPEGTGGGGDLGSLVPDEYKWAWNLIKSFRPGDYIPWL